MNLIACLFCLIFVVFCPESISKYTVWSRLYGLPKIHKPGNKMREICDNTNAPTSNLSKWLLQEFMKIGHLPGKAIKNSTEFVEKTKNIILEADESLVSFDVCALFPSIPIDNTLIFLEKWLRSKHIEDGKVKMYTSLTKLCMKQNIFSFNGNFFKQTEGTAMGNILSPFLANLFMGYFEESLSNNKAFPRIWLRYVDDVFAVLKTSSIQDTLDLLNNQYASIKFTYEEEKNYSLAFLDLLIVRNSTGRIEYDVFRKPTSTPRYINGNSYHCFSHKYAAFSSMIHRLTSLPLSTTRFEKEKQYIRDLPYFNNLDDNIILNLISKRIKQHHLKSNTTLLPIVDKNKHFMRLTFFPKITEKMRKILTKNNIKVAYTSTNYKIKNKIDSCKEKLHDLEKYGVCKISCKDCNAVYIGMTSRNLKTKLKDHQYDIRSENGKTAISRHIIENKHTPINEECIQLIKQVNNNYKELCIWEAIFIHTHRSTAVNDNDGLIDSLLFESL